MNIDNIVESQENFLFDCIIYFWMEKTVEKMLKDILRQSLLLKSSLMQKIIY